MVTRDAPIRRTLYHGAGEQGEEKMRGGVQIGDFRRQGQIQSRPRFSRCNEGAMRAHPPVVRTGHCYIKNAEDNNGNLIFCVSRQERQEKFNQRKCRFACYPADWLRRTCKRPRFSAPVQYNSK